MARVAMVSFKKVPQGLAFLEGDEGQKHIAGQRQIERGVGFAVAVAVFLPSAGVAFVVVAVFHRPVLANRIGRALFLVCAEAGEEVAGVASRRSQGRSIGVWRSRLTKRAGMDFEPRPTEKVAR